MPVLAEAAKKRASYLLERGFKNPSKAPRSAKMEAAKLYPFPSESEIDIATGSYNVGEVYEDAQGRQMRYLGNGQWGEP